MRLREGWCRVRRKVRVEDIKVMKRGEGHT